VTATRPLRAPADHGATLAAPPLEDAGRILALNRQRLNQPDITFLGRPWAELQTLARRELLAAARGYMGDGGEPLPDSNSVSIIMAGHQPELFHPGVWVKNFVLHGLARQHGCVSVNLLVDNDAVKSVGLHVPLVRVPLPRVEQSTPRLASIPFDRFAADASYEEHVVQDEALFADFPNRVPTDWGFSPMLGGFWRMVLQHSQRTKLLGERFAAARREWERRWGCQNVEVPVSRVSQTEAFAWFACHLLADLPRFQEVYNASVHAYRETHGIRSRNHPVPDLAKDGDWFESPFWAWQTGAARRARLMARRNGDKIDLKAGVENLPALPLSPQYSVLGTRNSVSAWQALERSGFKVRPRALTNTLFARLFLCDLFIHGVGGGKYDELTDEIMRRFYGVEPPEFLVFSATLLLPFPHYPADADQCRRLARESRDLHWNPQRHMSLDNAAAKLVFQKNAWINQRPEEHGQRGERFRMLRELTEHLRGYTNERENHERREWARCELEVKANAVLRRRDYPFCLYPENMLHDFCSRFL
jgi:hypothetical protein